MSTGPERPLPERPLPERPLPERPLIDEQLSAWLDDELPAAELELLASRLVRAPEHRARVARYGLIGSTLRGGSPGDASATLAALEISARVRAAIDEIALPSARPKTRSLTRVIPYATAAGLLLLAVALMPLLRQTPAPGTVLPGAVAVQSDAPAPAERDQRLGQYMGRAAQPSLSPRRLTSYLVYHGEYSGMLSAKLTDSHIVNNRPYAVAMQAADSSTAP